MYPVGGGKIQRIARLHAKCSVLGVDVPNISVEPVEGRRVGVGEQACAGRTLALLRLRRLRRNEEEPLVAGQPTDIGT
jgi:hypothetical protein